MGFLNKPLAELAADNEAILQEAMMDLANALNIEGDSEENNEYEEDDEGVDLGFDFGDDEENSTPSPHEGAYFDPFADSNLQTETPQQPYGGYLNEPEKLTLQALGAKLIQNFIDYNVALYHIVLQETSKSKLGLISESLWKVSIGFIVGALFSYFTEILFIIMNWQQAMIVGLTGMTLAVVSEYITKKNGIDMDDTSLDDGVEGSYDEEESGSYTEEESGSYAEEGESYDDEEEIESEDSESEELDFGLDFEEEKPKQNHKVESSEEVDFPLMFD